MKNTQDDAAETVSSTDWLEERKRRVATTYAKMCDLERETGDVERELSAATEEWEDAVYELRAASSSNHRI